MQIAFAVFVGEMLQMFMDFFLLVSNLSSLYRPMLSLQSFLQDFKY